MKNKKERLKLKDVTLIGLDCVDLQRLMDAADICQKHFEFGAVKLLTSIDSNHPDVVKIGAVNSLDEYSRFVMKELYRYVDTPYALIFQHDGFILNPHAWSKEFLNYDYIGAPWWYSDGMNVGNGGFSLRSKRLLELLALDERITQCAPEDYQISRTYRRYLETQGMLFAPEAVAAVFSFEGSFRQGRTWNGQFGFHSYRLTDLSKWKLYHYVSVVGQQKFFLHFMAKIISWKAKAVKSFVRNQLRIRKVEPAVYKNYVGKYIYNNEESLLIIQEGDCMIGKKDSLSLRLYPESDIVYFVKELDASVTFVKSEANVVTGLNLFLQNSNYYFFKEKSLSEPASAGPVK